MKRWIQAGFLALLALTPTAPGGQETGGAAKSAAEDADPEKILRQAFFLEVAQCDPRAAAALYREVLSRPALPLRFAALAHLRLGICLHLLQEWEEAEKEFRSVVETHSGEEDAIRVALRYLGEAPRDLALFMPPDVLLYAEVVEPAGQVSFLSEVIRGTPLENPVDYSLLARPESSSSSPEASRAPASPQINWLRAFLNRDMLGQLQKIEGMAVGVTYEANQQFSWLLVFLPGTSDLSRIAIKTFLSSTMERAAPETIQGMAVFQLALESIRLYAAMDEDEEVFLLGSSRKVVVNAIGRQAPSGPGAGDPPRCLSDLDDFRRAQAARAGSMLFVYADREKAMTALRDSTAPEKLGAFDEARRLLGLDHLRGVAATVARAGDDLRITLHARVDPERHPIWGIFHTPPLRKRSISFVPEDSLAILTSTVLDGERRWRIFRSSLDPLVNRLPAASGKKQVRQFLEFLDSGLGLDLGRDILGELESITVAVPARIAFPPQLSFFLVLDFRDGDLAAPRVEKLLGAIACRLVNKKPPLEFRDQMARGTIRIRSCEPAPGIRILCAREGNSFIISPLAPMVLQSVEARASGKGAVALVPALASKALILKPREIQSRAGPPEPRSGGEALLSHIPRAIFLTEEAPDGFAFELRIPGITQVLRDTLKDSRIRFSIGQPAAGEK